MAMQVFFLSCKDNSSAADDTQSPNFPSSATMSKWDIIPLTYATDHTFSPDGKTLAIAYFGLVKLVDVESGTVIGEFGERRLENNFRPSAYPHFNADGSKLLVDVEYTGYDANSHKIPDSIMVVDIKKGVVLHTFSGMESPIFSSDGEYVAGINVISFDVEIYSAVSGSIIKKISELTYNGNYVGFFGMLGSFCNNSKNIIFSHVSSGFYVLDWQSEQVVANFTSSDWAYHPSVSQNGQMILFSENNAMKVFDAYKLELIDIGMKAYNPYVKAISPDGRFILFEPYRNSRREKPTIFRVSDGKQMLVLESDPMIQDYTGYAFSPDNKTIIASTVRFDARWQDEPGHYIWKLK